MPAGWPKNELIGKKVLIPLPADEKTAKERAKMYENYGWWLCYKSKHSRPGLFCVQRSARVRNVAIREPTEQL
jgi:hypothetical protein